MANRKLEQDGIIATIRTIKGVDNGKEKNLYSLTIMDRDKKYIVDCTWHNFEQQQQYAIGFMAGYKKGHDKGYDEGYEHGCDKCCDDYSIS